MKKMKCFFSLILLLFITGCSFNDISGYFKESSTIEYIVAILIIIYLLFSLIGTLFRKDNDKHKQINLYEELNVDKKNDSLNNIPVNNGGIVNSAVNDFGRDPVSVMKPLKSGDSQQNNSIMNNDGGISVSSVNSISVNDKNMNNYLKNSSGNNNFANNINNVSANNNDEISANDIINVKPIVNVNSNLNTNVDNINNIYSTNVNNTNVSIPGDEGVEISDAPVIRVNSKSVVINEKKD